MSSSALTLIGLSIAVLAYVGYYAQRHGIAPAPRLIGIDLGTTFSSIALFEPQTGETIVLSDHNGIRSIPSVVAFLPNGSILVGTEAVAQQSMNPRNTIYDAKRFIGRVVLQDDPIFQEDIRRYPFTIKVDSDGFVYFELVGDDAHDGDVRLIRPEAVGTIIIQHLLKVAANYRPIEEKISKSSNKKTSPIKLHSEIVISVPAEFDLAQRNATCRAVESTGMKVRRVVSEPTAAALAYGLHTKEGVEYVAVVDLGGGTLDISILWLANGMFVVQAMAGNNRLGGQDFNQRIQQLLLQRIKEQKSLELTRKDDLQQLRLAIEEAKIQLTTLPEIWIRIHLHDTGLFEYLLRRSEFEDINVDLFESVLEPIQAALDDCSLRSEDIDEIVLVGGSTRIPRIRQIVANFFRKSPNFGVDPELAVAIGVAVQAGVLANGWPLQVSAMEIPPNRQKKHNFGISKERH